MRRAPEEKEVIFLGFEVLDDNDGLGGQDAAV
jgi:hypothetical protein